jgi:hypothetical protein
MTEKKRIVTVFVIFCSVFISLGCGRFEDRSSCTPEDHVISPETSENDGIEPEDNEEDTYIDSHRRIAWDKTSGICRRVMERILMNTYDRTDLDRDYRICRDWLLHDLEQNSKTANKLWDWDSNHFSVGDTPFGNADRTAYITVLRRDLQEGYACRAEYKRHTLEELSEFLRREAIKSGRNTNEKLRPYKLYKLCVYIWPGCDVFEEDLAPIIDAAMRAGIYRIAVLPSLTQDEENDYLEYLDSDDDDAYFKLLEKWRNSR